MKNRQTLGLAILEESLLFLAFVGGATVLWLGADNGTDWWHGALPTLFWVYPIRLVVELAARARGKPLLHLVPEDR